MDLKLYSIYDVVTLKFNKPFVEINDNSARRAFEHSLKSAPDTRDYELYFLGFMNEDTGDIQKSDSPIKLMTGFQLMQKRDEESMPAHLVKQAV